MSLRLRLVALLALAVFAHGCWARLRKYRSGRPVLHAVPLGRRLRDAVKLVASHSRLVKRDWYAGFFHALVFWGFLVLAIGTLIIFVSHDIFRPILPAWQFWKGRFYLWYSLALDLAAGALLLGLLAMAWRRLQFGLPQLDYATVQGPHGEPIRRAYIRDDWLFLAGLGAIALTGLGVEALRICADRPLFEVWSVLGWQLANGLDASGIGAAQAGMFHPYAWWAHGLIALAFIAYIPYSKAIHVIVGAANLTQLDPLAGKRLPSVDLEAPGLGYRKLEDFGRKELLALDSCTKCGRCHVSCPALAGGWPLSPRDLILNLREQSERKFGGRSWYNRRTAPRGTAPAEPTALAEPRTLWACTTCLACVDICPVAVEHVPMIVQMRRALVEEGQLDSSIQGVLEKLVRYGNSFGEPEANRAKWTEGLSFQIKDARREPVDYLWFVGDYASYDPDVQQVTRAAARVLQAAGLDFGILYEDEWNSGNDVRRVGEDGLYQLLVDKNVTTLAGVQFRTIITTDPHSYNTLRFEYPEFGATYEVRHFSEVIRDLIVAGTLKVHKNREATVTYHDPCHLSRYGHVTEAPRAILGALGARLVEMERHGSNSFCCGAGGGRIWMTDTGQSERPSVQRIREALRIPDLQCFVVACPKDRKMFLDAAKGVASDGALEVKDLIELVDEAIAL